MATPLIMHNGVEVTPDWPAKVEAAQQQLTYDIGGQPFPRIPYGMELWWDETWPPPTAPCRDCAVLPETSDLTSFVNELPSRLDTIHSENKRMFFECLNPETINYLEPVYE